MKKLPVEAFFCLVKLEFAYMMHNFRAGEKFLDALNKNIERLQLPKKLELNFMALAISAFGSKLSHRQLLCSRALDALDILTEN